MKPSRFARIVPSSSVPVIRYPQRATGILAFAAGLKSKTLERSAAERRSLWAVLRQPVVAAPARLDWIATRPADERGERSQICAARRNERARGEKTEKSAARGRIWIVIANR